MSIDDVLRTLLWTTQTPLMCATSLSRIQSHASALYVGRYLAVDFAQQFQMRTFLEALEWTSFLSADKLACLEPLLRQAPDSPDSLDSPDSFSSRRQIAATLALPSARPARLTPADGETSHLYTRRHWLPRPPCRIAVSACRAKGPLPC
jgi:hypothetical protein